MRKRTLSLAIALVGLLGGATMVSAKPDGTSDALYFGCVALPREPAGSAPAEPALLDRVDGWR